MEKKNRAKREIYCSMTEVERKYFPNSFKKKLEKKKEKSPTLYGTGLASEYLERVKKKLEHVSS